MCMYAVIYRLWQLGNVLHIYQTCLYIATHTFFLSLFSRLVLSRHWQSPSCIKSGKSVRAGAISVLLYGRSPAFQESRRDAVARVDISLPAKNKVQHGRYRPKSCLWERVIIDSLQRHLGEALYIGEALCHLFHQILKILSGCKRMQW